MKCYGMCCRLQNNSILIETSHRHQEEAWFDLLLYHRRSVCVGVHAGDIYSGAQFMFVAAFN